ncbi:MAG: NADPH-dependent F420 reductase [Candidatus Eremiobacteraeota bacterium]|nr:NADPH-dependent F420 reductase [Candidatus Eremiobacteraeota bacterium]
MNIGIIGSGHVGSSVGKLLAAKGHRIYYSFSHDSEKLEQLARESGNESKAEAPYDAVLCSEVVVLSTPWTQVDAALGQAGEIAHKIVIDTTNPYNPDFTVQTFDETDSSSEHIAKKMPQATIIKAFNTLPAETLVEKSGRGLALFYCGDDSVAKSTVAQLIEDCGFVPVDTGTLHDGRLQQPNTDRYNRELTKEQAEQLVGVPT